MTAQKHRLWPYTGHIEDRNTKYVLQELIREMQGLHERMNHLQKRLSHLEECHVSDPPDGRISHSWDEPIG